VLISFDEIVRKYRIHPKGILHLGAHLGEEAAAYQEQGVDRVLWVEANPALMPLLRRAVEPLGHRVYQGVVSTNAGERVEFKITNNGQSSSYLDLGTHASHYPGIHVVETATMETTTVAHIYRELGIEEDAFDFVNLDLQGSELDALHGMGPLLERFDTVYAEVNEEALYEGSPLLPDIDRFLHGRGFTRRALRMSRAPWGDALYVRGDVTVRERIAALFR
jgi:FkbM family methyltransferase